jgi:hypothetical protein
MLSALAQLPVTAEVAREVDYWCAHIWQHRRRANGMFYGSTGRKIADALAAELQHALAPVLTDPARRGLAPLLAEQIAGSMLSLLRAWIRGRTAATPSDIGAMLGSGARAIAAGAITAST